MHGQHLSGIATFGNPIGAGKSAIYTPQTGFSLPSPLPPSGYYAVASVLDPTNSTIDATAPLLEIGTSTQLLPMGQDLTGRIQVTSFSPVDPTQFTVPLEVTNVGLETAASTSYTLYFVDNGGDKISSPPAPCPRSTDSPLTTSTSSS